MIITRQDKNGVKPLLQTGEFGYDNYPAGGDSGRVYVGTGSVNIPLAKKEEMSAVDGKADVHIARVDNPHGVTKAQVGLGNVENLAPADMPISSAGQAALNDKANKTNADLLGVPKAPTAAVGTNSTQLATTAFVGAEIADKVYSKTQLNAGQLDNRYYTETEIDTLDSTTVKLTGNQTIAGIKTFSSNIVGGITGNSATATKLATARSIALAGDVTGSVTFDGSENVSITTIVQPNSVALGTDTTGNYMADIIAGSGISVSHTQGEGSTATITNSAPNVTTNITTTHNNANVIVNSSDGTDGTINAATQTLAGVMSAVDKTKLDGIETGATGDQTADEILTLLKTVDGSGSELDADLLDGQEGAYYLNASNINAGIINDARLPDTITSSITGNSGTATKLATARTINGVAFDGSANITVSDSTAVKLTGNQIVADVKTFSSNPISTAAQSTATNALTRRDYVDTKAPIASPTFTGTVTLPATTSIGNVSSTALGYLDGATSNIQTQLTGKAPSSHTHPVGQVTGLGTAATANITTSNTDITVGRVLKVGDFGVGLAISITDADLIYISGLYRVESGTLNIPVALWGSLYCSGDGASGIVTQIYISSGNGYVYTRGMQNSVWSPWLNLYHTGNTTKTPDGTLKASSPVINLYTDKHELHNESQFGATPVVTRKSKGVYEITGTLGLRSGGWYLDTPSDRNGNKYFNIEWTQNITPDTVDGVVDEYRDDIVVTIETFERAWNKDTGTFDNGNPIDINDLQNRFVQLRFNEIKVEQEVTNG